MLSLMLWRGGKLPEIISIEETLKIQNFRNEKEEINEEKYDEDFEEDDDE